MADIIDLSSRFGEQRPRTLMSLRGSTQPSSIDPGAFDEMTLLIQNEVINKEIREQSIATGKDPDFRKASEMFQKLVVTLRECEQLTSHKAYEEKLRELRRDGDTFKIALVEDLHACIKIMEGDWQKVPQTRRPVLEERVMDARHRFMGMH